MSFVYVDKRETLKNFETDNRPIFVNIRHQVLDKAVESVLITENRFLKALFRLKLFIYILHITLLQKLFS